jgi:prophage DNA circulation protein
MSAYDYFETKFPIRQNVIKYIKLFEDVGHADSALENHKFWQREANTAGRSMFDKESIQRRLGEDQAATEQELSRKLAALLGPFQTLGSQIAATVDLRREDLNIRYRKALANESLTELKNDLVKFSRDLGEVRGDYYHERYSVAPLDAHKRFLEDIIFELNLALNNKDETADRDAEVKKEVKKQVENAERQFQERVQSLEDMVSSLSEQLQRALNKSSGPDKLVDRLLAQAKSVSDAERRIREQWKAERDNASDEHRRDIDRIYHKILEQFREKS